MLTESFVAIMALVTACILDQRLYFAMNAPKALTEGTPQGAADYVNSLNLPGDPATAEYFRSARRGRRRAVDRLQDRRRAHPRDGYGRHPAGCLRR